jgi:hypothetical protein
MHQDEVVFFQTKHHFRLTFHFRRNTIAKLMQEEEKQQQQGSQTEKRLQSRNRHWSLNDLPNFHKHETRDSQKKR